jgi:serine/threonine protein phosphatase 1
MRKFIISDIHGNGNIYYSIISFLENVNENEDIELYINGDLIDRGKDSAKILLDVKRRIEEGNFKIEYLGGNHELLMYDYFKKKKRGASTFLDHWHNNGGTVTENGLLELLNYKESKLYEIADFVSNLKIYHKFNERINDKRIVLVHSACPEEVEDICSLRVKDEDKLVEHCLWTRIKQTFIPSKHKLGCKDYFTIIGHTPVEDKNGFIYHKNENYLNIDGGNSYYVCGYTNYDHTPLVEIEDGRLKILTFCNSNKIINGNYLTEENIYKMPEEELNEERKYLVKKYK